jgi:hypothetical protein
MQPSSSRAFQRDQEHDLEHPPLVDLIDTNKTKQNKLPSFIDRLLSGVFFFFSNFVM